MSRTSRWLFWILFSAGVAVRLIQFLHCRSLWCDEGHIAVNLLNRSYLGLLQPLDYHQGAPVGFLWSTRLLMSVLGKRIRFTRLLVDLRYSQPARLLYAGSKPLWCKGCAPCSGPHGFHAIVGWLQQRSETIRGRRSLGRHRFLVHRAYLAQSELVEVDRVIHSWRVRVVLFSCCSLYISRRRFISRYQPFAQSKALGVCRSFGSCRIDLDRCISSGLLFPAAPSASRRRFTSILGCSVCTFPSLDKSPVVPLYAEQLCTDHPWL